jgi:hypothetical protein
MGTCTTLMSNNNDNKWRMEEVEIQVQVDLLLVESWRSCVASRNAVWTGGLGCRKWVDRIQNSLLVSINQKYVYYKTRFYKKKALREPLQGAKRIGRSSLLPTHYAGDADDNQAWFNKAVRNFSTRMRCLIKKTMMAAFSKMVLIKFVMTNKI